MTKSYKTHLRRPGMVLATALSGALFGAATLQAQDQPTAFVHGYNADPSGWQPMVNNLSSQFAISPVVPNLTWQRRFADQRATLDATLAGKPALPGVGHSNGGLITRSYIQQSGNNRVDRIMAVNSAHGGAPLAANIVNGQVKNWVVTLTDAVVAPLTQLIPNPVFSRAIRGVVDLAAVVWTRTSDVLNAPVLHDMSTGSPFIQQLEANRWIEQSRAYSRVGIGTSVSPAGVFCHGLIAGSGWVTCRKTIRTVQTIYLGAGVFFRWTGRPGLGNSFINGATRLKRVDSDWLRFVGAGGTFNGYTGAPDASDGILPLGTQQYPGATRQTNLTFPQYNVSHQEANDPIHPMVSTYADVFASNFGLPRRGTSDPGDEPPPPTGGCADPTQIVCTPEHQY
jgi:pimeloyl-ACP methyl ester carboxylesterase